MRARSRAWRKFVGFYAPPALKRDLGKIAQAEDRTLSAAVCGLLPLGISRYFELADAKAIAPLVAELREALEDVFGDPFGSETGANARRARLAERAANTAEFEAAIDEGLLEFAAEHTTLSDRTKSSAAPASRPFSKDYTPLRGRISPYQQWARDVTPVIRRALSERPCSRWSSPQTGRRLLRD